MIGPGPIVADGSPLGFELDGGNFEGIIDVIKPEDGVGPVRIFPAPVAVIVEVASLFIPTESVVWKVRVLSDISGWELGIGSLMDTGVVSGSEIGRGFGCSSTGRELITGGGI